jgi:hypothetical protein
VDITVSVHLRDRSTKENWKEPFKKLKLSKVRAETEWSIFLHVHGKDVKRVRKLTEDLRVETVMDQIGEGQKFLDQELWVPEEKV